MESTTIHTTGVRADTNTIRDGTIHFIATTTICQSATPGRLRVVERIERSLINKGFTEFLMNFVRYNSSFLGNVITTPLGWFRSVDGGADIGGSKRRRPESGSTHIAAYNELVGRLTLVTQCIKNNTLTKVKH